MSETRVSERRRFVRYRGNPAIRATVSGDGRQSTGIVINVSRGGVYLLTEAFHFEEGKVNFHCPDGGVICKACRLIDAVREGGESLGVVFLGELTEDEVNLLKADGYEE